MASKTSSKKLSPSEVLGYVVVIAIIAVILAAVVYVYKAQQLSTLPPEESQTTTTTALPHSTPIPTPTPTISLLKHGKDTYNISNGSQYTGPNIQSVTLDPLDPAVGSQQSITVTITHKYAITNASLTIRTDTKTTQLPLSLVSGTNTDGTWQATWTVPETYNYTYIVTVSAQSNYDKGTIPISIRTRQ